MSTQNPSPENQPTPKPQGDAVGLVSSDLFGWVRIADRLPELGEIVWLWEEGRGPWIGSRDDPDNEGWLWGNAYGAMWHNGVKWDADVEQDDEYKPTHWQPLPLLPNK
jgi:hypothetical protein